MLLYPPPIAHTPTRHRPSSQAHAAAACCSASGPSLPRPCWPTATSDPPPRYSCSHAASDRHWPPSRCAESAPAVCTEAGGAFEAGPEEAPCADEVPLVPHCFSKPLCLNRPLSSTVSTRLGWAVWWARWCRHLLRALQRRSLLGVPCCLDGTEVHGCLMVLDDSPQRWL